jgi:hypothetical protein
VQVEAKKRQLLRQHRQASGQASDVSSDVSSSVASHVRESARHFEPQPESPAGSGDSASELSVVLPADLEALRGFRGPRCALD